MHTLAVLVGTILGLILQPLPTPSIALLGLALALITGTMDPATEALQGFSNPTIWLIAAASFIVEGFLLTGLGRRTATWCNSKLGASSRESRAQLRTHPDRSRARPATPPNTARSGGVLYPIIASPSHEQGSTPTPTPRVVSSAPTSPSPRCR